MTNYLYNASGDPVGFWRGRYVYTIAGDPVGQIRGTHVYQLSGPYVGELHEDMIVDKHIGSLGSIGSSGSQLFDAGECRPMVYVRVLTGTLKGEVGCVHPPALSSVKPDAKD